MESERERERKIWGCEPWERRQRGGNGMQRINSVKLHTLTPGSLHHTHTLVQTLSTHSISATNLSHVHPSSFILSFGFLRLNFLYLIHFLSTSSLLCARNGTLPYCPNLQYVFYGVHILYAWNALIVSIFAKMCIIQAEHIVRDNISHNAMYLNYPSISGMNWKQYQMWFKHISLILSYLTKVRLPSLHKLVANAKSVLFP